MSGLMHLFQLFFLGYSITFGTRNKEKIILSDVTSLKCINDSHSGDIDALHMAAEEGNDTAIKELISSGMDVDSRYNTSYVTPLYLAAANSHNSTLILLLDHGANIEAEVETEVDTLHLLSYAVYKNNTIAVTNLLDNGADFNPISRRLNITEMNWYDSININSIDVKPGKLYFSWDDYEFLMNKNFKYLALKPLSIAAYYCWEDMVELLVNYGSSIDGAEGEISPLAIAIVKGCEKVALMLLKLGALTNCTIAENWHPLHFAISKNMEEVVQYLSKTDLLNDRDELGRTPLNLAVAEYRVYSETLINLGTIPDGDNISKILLDHGADVNTKDNKGFTPLHVVISLETAKALLESGVDVNAQDKYGNTPLHSHIRNHNVNIVKLLLMYNASMDITCKINFMSLSDHFMVYLKFLKIVLSRQTRNNSTPISGLTPISLAAVFGYKEILPLLIERNKFMLNPENYEWPPLHYLVYYWVHWPDLLLPKLKFLIDHGANVNIKDAYSFTPLHLAIMIGEINAVSALLDLKADVNASDINGWTPFLAAVYNQDINIAQVLMKAGCGIDIADRNGFTSLMWSIMGYRYYFFKLMVEKTLDLTSTNRYRYYSKMAGLSEHEIYSKLSQINKTFQPESILDIYHASFDLYDDFEGDDYKKEYEDITNKHINMFKWISEKTANLDMQDEIMGWTALHWASASGDFDVVKFLVERGAYKNTKSLLGHTPMFLARYWGQKGIYEYLKQHGAVW